MLIVYYLFPTCIGTFTTILIKYSYNKLPYCKITTVPAQTCYRSVGSQEAETPGFLYIRHMRMVRWSALRTGPLYPPGNIPGTHFC